MVFMFVECNCDYCGIVINRCASRIKRARRSGSGIYCSNVCHIAKTNTKITIACKECGADVVRTKNQVAKNSNVFCGHTCAARHSNRSRGSGNIKLCKGCSVEFLLINKLYCSDECKRNYIRRDVIHKLENGINIPPRPNGVINKVLRILLIDKAGNKCSRCGWSEINEFTNRVPLEVHHVDGDFTNNVISNLIILCPNCHALTSNYRSRNKNQKTSRVRNKLNETQETLQTHISWSHDVVG